jgi:plasmid stabilization system protein ParE
MLTRRLVLRTRAEQDLAEAARWYEEQATGLGRDLLEEADVVIARVMRFPESHPVRHRQFRRALLRRFPYGVFYAVEADEIVILAVLHLAQDPSAIFGRLD